MRTLGNIIIVAIAAGIMILMAIAIKNDIQAALEERRQQIELLVPGGVDSDAEVV